MSEPLTLFETPPVVKLTERQELALAIVERAHEDGVHTEEVGAELCARRGKHSADDLCQWCGSNGKAVLEELQAKGLVQYRRANRARNIPGAWLVVSLAARDELPPGMTDEIPF